MAKIYIKNKYDLWDKVDVGRTDEVIIHVDYGGCTGHTLRIDMDKLWLTDGKAVDEFPVGIDQCLTTNIGKIRINGEDME